MFEQTTLEQPVKGQKAQRSFFVFISLSKTASLEHWAGSVPQGKAQPLFSSASMLSLSLISIWFLFYSSIQLLYDPTVMYFNFVSAFCLYNSFFMFGFWENWGEEKKGNDYFSHVLGVSWIRCWFCLTFVLLLLCFTSILSYQTEDQFFVGSLVIVIGFVCWFCWNEHFIAVVFMTFEIACPFLDFPFKCLICIALWDGLGYCWIDLIVWLCLFRLTWLWVENF